MSAQTSQPPKGGSQLLRWADRVSAPALWAIAATLGLAYVVITVLAVGAWQQAGTSVQILDLLSIVVGFAVLLWGFWGGVFGAAAACVATLVTTVVAGHYSLASGIPLSRAPFLLECLLFIALAWISLRFLEREEVEEIADRRVLDGLEEEYLSMAIEFGKREELLKVLEKKADRLRQLDGMSARIGAAAGREPAIQVCLEEVLRVVGKGEAEVVLFQEAGQRRHARGAPPLDTPDGRDEIDRWLDEHRTALLVNNLTHDVRFTHEFGRSRQIVSVVAVPLVWDGRMGGTLRLTSVTPQAFSHDDLRFASEAAAQLLPRLTRPD